MKVKEAHELMGGLFVLKLGGREAEAGERKYRVKRREGCRGIGGELVAWVGGRGEFHIFPPLSRTTSPHATRVEHAHCETR